jgi:hypothetical protein
MAGGRGHARAEAGGIARQIQHLKPLDAVPFRAHAAGMSEDPFETVAIAYSQAQAGVILSLFEWNCIPAYGANLETVRTSAPLTLALGGIPIRVAREAAVEARTILREAEERAAGETREVEPLADRITKVAFLGVTGMTPPPRLGVEIVG